MDQHLQLPMKQFLQVEQALIHLQFFSFIKIKAAEPSFKPDAFPAVTVPSFLKTGLSELIFSKVEPCLETHLL